MNKTITFIIILVIIVVGGGFIYINSGGTQNSKNSKKVEKPSSTSEGTSSDWVDFSKESFNFSFNHPSDVSLSEFPDSNSVHIRYRGLNNVEDRQITDGYTLVIQHEDISPNQDLEGYVKRRMKEQSQALKIIKEPSRIDFPEDGAFRYKVRAEELGDTIRHTVWTAGTSSVFDVFDYVKGANSQNYQRTVDSIIETIEHK